MQLFIRVGALPGSQLRFEPEKPELRKRRKKNIKPVGSRLATKRVCATRAQWAEQRKQDREETEKAQRLGCLTQDACGGF